MGGEEASDIRSGDLHPSAGLPDHTARSPDAGLNDTHAAAGFAPCTMSNRAGHGPSRCLSSITPRSSSLGSGSVASSARRTQALSLLARSVRTSSVVLMARSSRAAEA